MTVRCLFREGAAERHFREEGYVTLPLLGEELIARLRDIFEQHHPQVTLAFRTTMRSEDLEQRARVDREVRAALDDLLRDVLVDCRLVYGNYAVKNTGERSRILPHQDWAIVDERRHVSIGVWCPLDDVDERNGMLCVMKKSHLNVRAFRGGAPRELPDYIAVYPELLPAELVSRHHVPLPLRAGTALFYDHRTVHYSPPNLSDRVRIAVLLGLVPREAQLVHFYRSGERDVGMHAIPDDYFARTVYHDRPDGPKLCDVEYECRVTYPRAEL